ncbi:16S rRNA (cytosine(1402)-N(4))-methyltransferase RsmH [Actinobacteria bacterium YIM 96077]|uniref:Ribosomal RNA small subunit methyltransferase H n=1 Tax=Phytoactinopolyspora halophila TaxID=1981511 RepID=A0A329QVA5_9ACTN|nr:16S rRNA (cytosine(1402)-N(4))-methyltransferase RsmH [Phytoactinopolyspora halophila]AYY12837.1 16S rRNA (cytosine(1402)-N(4))-methyltransferase RsmH [Actinobacteria bacterium YIM 96077]RAW16370.1 16S rRNA (cytosine(1402)-N(4))-methyltransferase [Phytoactinopolyspora halophila]
MASEQWTPGGAHVPVLLDRVTSLLAPALESPGSVVVDATLGLGGHAEAVLQRCPAAQLIGLDRDPKALDEAQRRLGAFGDRVTTVNAVYDEIGDVLAERGIERIHGVLFDLGVSSLQLDETERGFSYAHDAPLDMRMNQEGGGRTAADVLNTYDARTLARVLRIYGEERYASRIATAIARQRKNQPFETTGQLVEVVRAAIPAPARRTGGHPAKRTFQALRIEVNGELSTLERALPGAVDALAVGGRAVVLSYHSLEDRIVKRLFAARAASTAPPGLPVELPEHRPVARLLAKGEVPDEAEIETNPRAASARLRALERVRTHGEERP